MPTPQHHSLRMAFAVLNSLHAANEWMSCDELSRRSPYPEVSTDRTLRTLEELGAVVRDSRGRCRLHPCFSFLPNGKTPAADQAATGDNVIYLALKRRAATS